jgi:hypothetical protein
VFASIYRRVPLGLASTLIAMHGWAHHSGGMFDDTRLMTLTGTVSSFQWTNPHCWIQVQIPGSSGSVEWSVEMGSPSLLFRAGWRPGSLKPGDRITVVIHPMRDGTSGGLFVSSASGDRKPL